jgi:hypothetical protein
MTGGLEAFNVFRMHDLDKSLWKFCRVGAAEPMLSGLGQEKYVEARIDAKYCVKYAIQSRRCHCAATPF